MSLYALAHHMAAQGRGPDTMLMHVAPDEVARLQAVARARGGSLTINPHTGLVEAGFFSDLAKPFKAIAKPVVGGINDLLGPAAAPIMGAVGMAFGVPPGVSAAIWGGLSGLATGSLKQGLLAGAGAYGGANLYQGFANAGAQQIATQEAAKEAAASELAGNTVAQNTAAVNNPTWTGADLEQVSSISPSSQIGPSVANPTAPVVQTATAATPAVPTAPVAPPPPTPAPVPSSFDTALAKAGESASNAWTGLKDVTVGGGGLDTLAASMPAGATTGLKTSAALAAAPAISAAIDAAKMPKDSGAPDLDTAEYSGLIRPWEFERSVRSPSGSGTGERMWFADRWTPLKTYTAPGPEYKAAMGGVVPEPYGDVYVGYASGGGISSLGGYSDGGRMLKGPGDGMSDSIPATINNKQPARLADNEFVVPADVVAHLGNGSSDAGAKQLYKMMDRVRQARTGKRNKRLLSMHSATCQLKERTWLPRRR